MFSKGCELRIGKKKFNLQPNDLLYGRKYEYGLVIHWFNGKGETTRWMWDEDWIVNHTSLEEVNKWIKEVNLAHTKDILNLDDLPSAYIIVNKNRCKIYW